MGSLQVVKEGEEDEGETEGEEVKEEGVGREFEGEATGGKVVVERKKNRWFAKIVFFSSSSHFYIFTFLKLVAFCIFT